MSADEVSIELYVHTDKVGSKCTRTIQFDREEWEGMTSDEQEKAMFDALWDSGMVDWGYEVKS